MDALIVEHIAVKRGRLLLNVRVGEGVPRMTDAALARRLLASRPSLAHHTCANALGPTFGDVISRTSLPHVLEHLIIDEQTRDARTSAATIFVGTTEWLDEAAGLARVEVNFADDLVALGALRNALSFLNVEVLS